MNQDIKKERLQFRRSSLPQDQHTLRLKELPSKKRGIIQREILVTGIKDIPNLTKECPYVTP